MSTSAVCARCRETGELAVEGFAGVTLRAVEAACFPGTFPGNPGVFRPVPDQPSWRVNDFEKWLQR